MVLRVVHPGGRGRGNLWPQREADFSTLTAHCLKLGSREMGSKAPRVTRLELVSEKWKGMKTWPGATMPVMRSSRFLR